MLLRTKAAGLSAGLLLLAAGAAFAAPPATTRDVVIPATVFVDANNMTLYTYDRDTVANETTCYMQCAVNWPPFMAAADAVAEGDWTIVTRTDATKMWAYKGKPLYLYINDKAPGDVVGEGRGGVWHLAKP